MRVSFKLQPFRRFKKDLIFLQHNSVPSKIQYAIRDNVFLLFFFCFVLSVPLTVCTSHQVYFHNFIEFEGTTENITFTIFIFVIFLLPCIKATDTSIYISIFHFTIFLETNNCIVENRLLLFYVPPFKILYVYNLITVNNKTIMGTRQRVPTLFYDILYSFYFTSNYILLHV